MKALGITTLAAAAAKSLQLCLTLQPQRRQPTRLCRPWGSPGKDTGVGCHFLLQCMKVKSLSCVSLLATPWTAAFQAPPSMEFSRQEYWNGVPWPSPYYTWENLFIWFLRKKFICIGEGVFFLSLSLFTRCQCRNPIYYILCSQRWRSSIQSAKNKTGSWLWLTSWIPFCQIQT